DGLLFVGPGSAPNAVRMIYFGSAGSGAAMCGKAALCGTRRARRLGIARTQGMVLETDAGSYESRSAGPGERAELRLAAVPAPTPVPGLAGTDGERRVALGLVGVPHLVVLVDDVSSVDLAPRGRALRSDPALGPDGANVNFVSPRSSPSEWSLRTYERGVGAEAPAGGTGAFAAAFAGREWA